MRPILADGGSPPLRGNCCFTVRYLSTRAITTDLTLRPPLFTLRPPLSHTPLSHTTLTHDALTHHSQTHCSHTRTTALTPRPSALLSLEEMARRLCLQHVSQEPGTWNPLSHKGLRGNRGLGSGPPSRVQRGGRGCQKDDRRVWGAGEGRLCPQLRPTIRLAPARILVHSRTK